MRAGRRQRPNPSTPVFVYAIDDGQFIKLGASRAPRCRAIDLQAGNARRLTLIWTADGGFKMEKKLHWLFADHRMEGEWFDLRDIVERNAYDWANNGGLIGMLDAAHEAMRGRL